jgi:excisionase family DNA binding protein
VIEDEMLTIGDVARYLKLKPQTIYRWVQDGKLPGAKIGKAWRFRRSSIERWVDTYMKGDGVKPGSSSDGARGGDSSSSASGERAGKKRAAKKRRGPDSN